jgi:hypothetical protein
MWIPWFESNAGASIVCGWQGWGVVVVIAISFGNVGHCQGGQVSAIAVVCVQHLANQMPPSQPKFLDLHTHTEEFLSTGILYLVPVWLFLSKCFRYFLIPTFLPVGSFIQSNLPILASVFFLSCCVLAFYFQEAIQTKQTAEPKQQTANSKLNTASNHISRKETGKDGNKERHMHCMCMTPLT